MPWPGAPHVVGRARVSPFGDEAPDDSRRGDSSGRGCRGLVLLTGACPAIADEAPTSTALRDSRRTRELSCSQSTFAYNPGIVREGCPALPFLFQGLGRVRVPRGDLPCLLHRSPMNST